MKNAAAGRTRSASALWYVDKGKVELRAEPLPEPTREEVLVRTLFSGVSRGTERLILSGAVPLSEGERMRAPFQRGAFPFPVKYGYCAAGVVEAGPKELRGRTVFVLHPHQDFFVAPASLVAVVPDAIPPKRATLAANMETALNALWDANCGPGDRIVVVGGGVIGLLTAFLAAKMPGTEVTLVDVMPERDPIARQLGVGFAVPSQAPRDADVVFHTSATAEGLSTAIGAAGLEGTIVEMSWYGEGCIPVPLGCAFHSRRLRLISSQVTEVAPTHRPRWTRRRRLEAALSLLQDPCLDALITDEIDFTEAPARLPKVLAANAPGLAPVIRYSAAV
jgi:2-desacetyl-2-hydroxyethyl bacteriochlorophyllide A dehydrogenase